MYFFLFGLLVIGHLLVVLSFSKLPGSIFVLSVLLSVLSFANRKPSDTNPMSILYVSLVTGKKCRSHHSEPIAHTVKFCAASA